VVDRLNSELEVDLIATGTDVDAFGRQRVSTNYTLFDGQFRYGISDLIWKKLVTSGGTVTYNTSTNDVTLACTSAANSRAVLQSPYLRYQPGKSNFIKITANPNALNETFKLVVRKGGSDTNFVAQSNFNRDKVNGSGVSGFDFNKEAAQIFSFDFQHLGVGIIRFCLEKETGETIVAHVFENPNVITEMYMYTAQLPLRFEIINNGTNTYKRWGYFDDNNGIFFEFEQATAADSFTAFCCAVESENGSGLEDEFGLFFGSGNGTGGKSVSTTLIPVISIRPKLLFSTKPNRGIVLPTDLSVLSSARNIRVALCLNPTLVGSTFAAFTNSNSNTEVDTAATAFGSAGSATGTILREFFLESSQNILLSKNLIGRLSLGLNVAGSTADIFTLAVQTLTSTTTLNAAIGWKEFH
jgi:hypothetical protein